MWDKLLNLFILILLRIEIINATRNLVESKACLDNMKRSSNEKIFRFLLCFAEDWRKPKYEDKYNFQNDVMNFLFKNLSKDSEGSRIVQSFGIS